MDTKHDLSNLGDDRIVYVRSVKAQDLPEDVRAQLGGLDHLYAVHNSDGERLALVKDRKLAFALARQNDLAPVTVH
ncbi:DUF1150 family protein [Thetidibacter halocola]|uniref:DUF1150 domain-containing protein n=1 Tax=Thetidibacter halocola TaxID=2827239 RepID=A0A8J7WIJ6_9RHOB|nr:DUF1150 domain-containing protein [Thetidibacter halocola]MBS0125906.1 DUF1150 domain-containing protein [Thetidibacter halocola]